jgi:L-asparaginase II
MVSIPTIFIDCGLPEPAHQVKMLHRLKQGTSRSVMSNPVLVETLRGGRIESFHRGSVAVMDADGAAVLLLGETDKPIFPRSAVKAIQALPLIETGAADRYGLTDAEIALACASHSGEDIHAEAALSMLQKAGRDEASLECGAHWPFSTPAAQNLLLSGKKPGARHNNCSGKHAGFVCAACAAGIDPQGYVEPQHAVQGLIREAMESLTGAPHKSDECGTDGCSIPTYPAPLRALALAFARYGTGIGMGPERAKAAHRIRKAIAAAPLMIAGEGRFDTLLATAFGERLVAKVGAEGVYCAAFPELGLGIAIKCDDGAIAAAEIVMATLIERFLATRSNAEEATLEPLVRKRLTNWNGRETGSMRPAAALLA